MTARRRALPLVAAFTAVVIAAFALSLPTRAAAHASLTRSDPADGSRLGSSPREIRLWFDEDVSGRLSRATLTGARAGRVAGVEAPSSSGRALVLALPSLARDTYILSWLTVSQDDLHLTRGSLVFAVGAGATAVAAGSGGVAQPGGGGADAGEVVVRWIDFGAIAGLIGALALLVLALPAAVRRGATGLEAVRRRLAGLAGGSAAVALVSGGGLLLLRARSIPDAGAAAVGAILSGTSYGPDWIAREILIGALLGIAIVLRGRAPGRLLSVLTALAAIGLCGALALTSHSASLRGHLSVGTAAMTLHLLSAALWAGGVGALAVALGGRWRRSRDSGSALLLLRSFGGLAALSVAVLGITGVYSAGVEVASADALVTTQYGGTLLVKAALFLVLGTIGLRNAALVRAGAGRGRRMGRGLGLEAAVAAVVVLAAALLTATPPARGPRLAPPPAQATAAVPAPIRSAQVADLLVSLSVRPNRPGVNFLTAGVFDTRRPPPAPIGRVEFSLERAGVAAWRAGARIDGQHWRISGAELDRGGRWSIRLRIRRAGLPDQVARIPWRLPPAASPPAQATPAAPGRPLARVLSPAAAAGAIALAAGLILLALRRRAPSRSRSAPRPPVEPAGRRT